ncbi:hypothetical protein MMC28_008657 [Mycoblastus sanguinarius]|nr:hypothetical protein [Mycoblastus sanguinarius]
MYTTSNPGFSPQATEQGQDPSLSPAQSRRPQQQLQQPQKAKRGQGREPQKLRMSCDACAASKVRCSKERPSCERCIESNFTCVYGPSMKHGQSSTKRRQPEPRPASGSFQVTPVSSEQKYQSDLQKSFSHLLQNIGSTANLSSTRQWSPSTDVAITGTNLYSAPPSTTSPAFGDPIWTDAMAFDHTSSSETGTVSPANRGRTNTDLDSFDDELCLISNTDFSQFINPEPSNSISSLSSTTSQSAPKMNGPLLQPSIPHDGLGAHDCHVIANSTLAILHFRPRFLPSENGSNAISSLSPSSSARAPMQAVQNLDDVLRCTRDAMGNLLELLKCPCARDPHMAMLDASIITRVLFWHQLAAGVKTSSSLPLPTSDGSQFIDTFNPTVTTAGSCNRSSCSTPTVFVASEPVKIGTYIPDHEDQEPMRRLFLLISLKKLGRLIDTFAQVGESLDAGPSQLHVTLASWLNSELSQAVKEVEDATEAAVSQPG